MGNGGTNTGSIMKMNSEKNENSDCIDLHINIPCELANRVRGYAKKNGTCVENVLIEALDAFIRSGKNLEP
jgi:hypothetical protein